MGTFTVIDGAGRVTGSVSVPPGKEGLQVNLAPALAPSPLHVWNAASSTWIAPTDAQVQAAATAEGWSQVRLKRNQLLDGSLWAIDTVSPLSPADQAAYQAYRASLHRVTVDYATPDVVSWPSPPAYTYPSSSDRFCGEVDRQVNIKAKTLLTLGAHKALLYSAKAAEVKAYRSLTSVLLQALDGATMAASYPTLMAMVAVWTPTATTDAAKRTALLNMVTKVEAGIAASMVKLRTADALGNKAKEDIRAATTDAARATLLATVTAAIAAL